MPPSCQQTSQATSKRSGGWVGPWALGSSLAGTWGWRTGAVCGPSDWGSGGGVGIRGTSLGASSSTSAWACIVGGGAAAVAEPVVASGASPFSALVSTAPDVTSAVAEPLPPGAASGGGGAGGSSGRRGGRAG